MRLSLWTAACIISFLTLYRLSVSNNAATYLPQNFRTKPESQPRLHLVVPADKADVNLCKLIATAAALGYPPPIIINWELEFKDKTLAGSGSHIGKIHGISNLLNDGNMIKKDDMVLIIDAYDVWFQLPPAIMLQRYHAINAAADARLSERMGGVDVAKLGMQQTIVVSVEKRCIPVKSREACDARPETPLPQDLYGAETVQKDDDPLNEPFERNRERWLNSGVWLGRAADLQRLFVATARASTITNMYGSDQHVFGVVWIEQERRRTRLAAAGPKALKLIEEERQKNVPIMEFNLGLDYESSVSQGSANSENDLEWLTFNDRSSIDAALQKHNVTKTSRGELVLKQDLKDSSPSDTLPAKFSNLNSWSDLPLWTDLWTHSIPAIIHHNAYGAKSRRETQWRNLWLQRSLRSMLEARSKEAPVALGQIDGREIFPSSYWNYSMRALKGNEVKELSWNQVCESSSNQVFEAQA